MTDIKLYSVKDVMALLSVSQRTVYRLIKDGKLKALKVGMYLKVTEADLNSFLASCRLPEAADAEAAQGMQDEADKGSVK